MGGTGECGKALLEKILKNQRFSQVHLVARRSTLKELQARYPEAKISESVIDFDTAVQGKLESNPFEGCQQVFCCMGTTKANAGSAEAFVRIDKDYVLASADYAKKAGSVDHFHYISSAGASETSMFLYPKTKGQIQSGLANLKFPILSIYQPGLLLCDRTESRPGEAVARFFGNAISKITNSGSCSTAKVGAAMIQVASSVTKSEQASVKIYSNNEIHAQAKGLQN